MRMFEAGPLVLHFVDKLVPATFGKALHHPPGKLPDLRHDWTFETIAACPSVDIARAGPRLASPVFLVVVVLADPLLFIASPQLAQELGWFFASTRRGLVAVREQRRKRTMRMIFLRISKNNVNPIGDPTRIPLLDLH